MHKDKLLGLIRMLLHITLCYLHMLFDDSIGKACRSQCKHCAANSILRCSMQLLLGGSFCPTEQCARTSSGRTVRPLLVVIVSPSFSRAL